MVSGTQHEGAPVRTTEVPDCRSGLSAFSFRLVLIIDLNMCVLYHT